MVEAFKTGFAYAAGVFSAALIFVAVLGVWDWASEWARHIVSLIKLSRGKREV